MTVAMKFVEAGKFSLLRKCFDMVLSFAFQILYFGASLPRAACFLYSYLGPTVKSPDAQSMSYS